MSAYQPNPLPLVVAREVRDMRKIRLIISTMLLELAFAILPDGPEKVDLGLALEPYVRNLIS